MLQAEVGGGGRVDPEEGLQKPGYLIRDFVLMSAQGGRDRHGTPGNSTR